MFNAFELYDMNSLINAGNKLDISNGNIHLKAGIIKPDDTRLIVNYFSLIDLYRDYINKILVEVELTDKEMIQYMYQPKKFCYDKYGTTELWATLLRVNNMTSSTDFNKQKIKMFRMDIFDVLNEILILEEKTLQESKDEALK